MTDLVSLALTRLRAAGVSLDPGLSDQEVARVEDRLAFAFGPEHRALIQAALPVGHRSWPDWRSGTTTDLRDRLDWPMEGVIFDVHQNDFWPASWGSRPDDSMEMERTARGHLAHVPRLTPLCSHRYLTVDPEFQPSPVFSAYQTDVVYYGDNLLDYVAHEFRAPPRSPSPVRPHVPFWSDLAEDVEMDEL